MHSKINVPTKSKRLIIWNGVSVKAGWSNQTHLKFMKAGSSHGARRGHVWARPPAVQHARMGEKGGDVPRETQFLLVESKGAASDEAAAAYVVFLPLVEGAFRASLQGGAGDEL